MGQDMFDPITTQPKAAHSNGAAPLRDGAALAAYQGKGLDLDNQGNHRNASAPPARAPDDLSDITASEVLLNSVRTRLDMIANALPTDPQLLRQSVLQCVQALDLLHTGLTRELIKAELLQDEVIDTKTALARARETMVDLRGGERRARHHATHDGLTLLPNRELFRSRLLHAVSSAGATGQPLAVLYLDLDGFKQVNDLHGHAAGDQMLRVVAARLNQAVRVEDVVSRLGGDEFACMLGGFGNDADLGLLAAKLYDDVSGVCKIGEADVMVTPSIGIALWPMDGDTAERLMSAADAAMYRAKRSKLGYAFCDPAKDAGNRRGTDDGG
jgi:diguanylate cyclase (GGDEF)-like protein